MITEDKVTEIFYMADDFCKFFDAMTAKYALKPTGKRKYHRNLLLSGKNKLKALYLFIHRCCSRFNYPGAWFSVLNCKHYKMCLF